MGGDQQQASTVGSLDTGMAQTAPQAIPQRKTFFGWVSQTLSPTTSRQTATTPMSIPTAPSAEPVEPIAPLPVTASAPATDAFSGMGPARSPSVRRPRRDSSGLTHDEALNISRAGLSPPVGTPGANAMARNRQRSNSKYDKLGLMAAYSGGPSSF